MLKDSAEQTPVTEPCAPVTPARKTTPHIAQHDPLSPEDVTMVDYVPKKDVHFNEDQQTFHHYSKPFPSKIRMFFREDIIGQEDYGTHHPPYLEAREPAPPVVSPAAITEPDTPQRLLNHPNEDSPLVNRSINDTPRTASNVDSLINRLSAFSAFSSSREHDTQKTDPTVGRHSRHTVATTAAKQAQAKRLREAEERRLKKQQLKEEQRLKEAEERKKEAERRKALNIIRPLSQEWEQTLGETLKIKAPHKEINAKLLRKDLSTILPLSRAEGSGLLNDEIVYNYLALLVERVLEKHGHVKGSVPPRFHAFNSHMYSTYKSKGNDIKSVLNWVKRAKISGRAFLDTDTVLIPINDHLHWTLLVISGARRTVTYYDSLGGKGRAYTDFGLALARGTLGEEAWAEGEWSVHVRGSIQQTNGLDCGAFVCLNALALVKGLDPLDAFEEPAIPQARRQIAATLINAGFTGEFDFSLP